MREQIENRLAILRQELEKGQSELARLERQEAYLRETILRISGAIQVLEELLASGQPTAQNQSHTGEMQPAPVKTNGANA